MSVIHDKYIFKGAIFRDLAGFFAQKISRDNNTTPIYTSVHLAYYIMYGENITSVVYKHWTGI